MNFLGLGLKLWDNNTEMKYLAMGVLLVLAFNNCTKLDEVSSETVQTTPNSKVWTRTSNNLVINPSHFRVPPTDELGFNTADPCVIFDNKTNKWHAYLSSMILSQDIQVIKHAESSDAKTWTVQYNPALVLGAAGTWDSRSVETCSVVTFEQSPGVTKYYLYFSGTDTDLGNDQDVYKMGLAISDNPNTFTRITAAQSPKATTGLLFDALDAFASNPAITKGVVTDPKLLFHNGQFLMWYFCAGANNAGSYLDGGVCYATSINGIQWTQMGSLPTLLNVEAAGVVPQQPTVVFNSSKNIFEMWLVIDDPAYVSYGIPGLAVGGYYHATSPNGLTWTYTSKTSYDFSWNQNLISENNGLANGPEVVFRNGIYYLFFSSFTNQGIPASGYPPFTWGLNLATKGTP